MPSVEIGRILLVDDEPALLSVLHERLSAQGFDVFPCSSGSEALQALQEKSFDVLLTDLTMPEMDGVSLLEAATKIDPHLAGILMTGQGTVQTAVEALKAGAVDYILKPFKTPTILPVLIRAMEIRRLRVENLQLRDTLAIHDLCLTIAYTTDLQTILNKVAEGAVQQCEADEASVMLPTADGKELSVCAVCGSNGDDILGKRLPLEPGIAGWLDRQRELLALSGEVRDPRFAPVHPRPDISASISMPMLAGGNLVGVLNVNSAQSRRSFNLGRVKGLSILASTAAAAIESARLVEAIRGLNQDLEQRVSERTAELERANRAKDHFLATMSHELRTPLNAILGFTGTLLMKLPGPLTADQEKQLRTVQRSGKHLLSLINDMLDLARIESGKVELRPEPLVLQNILQEAIGILRPLADSKGLNLEVEMLDKPLVLRTDARAFNQILLNLANNAIKFTDRGKVSILVRTFESEARQTVAIEVTDTGIGISPEDQVHLFQAFTQVGNPSQRRTGTGLGLHLSRRLAELLGGGITCRSALGNGSTFTLVLPCGS